MISQWSLGNDKQSPPSQTQISTDRSSNSKMLKGMLSSHRRDFSQTQREHKNLFKSLHQSNDITQNTKSVTNLNNFPTILESPNNSTRFLSNKSVSGFIQIRRLKSKALSADQQDKIMIKSQWRELGKYQMFDDYIRIRDAQGLKQFRNESQSEEIKLLETDKKVQMFGSQEQEKFYQEEQRKKELERVKESLTKQGAQNLIMKQSFLIGDDISLVSQKREVRLLLECFKTLEKLKSKLISSTIESLQPLLDDLTNMFTHFGVVNFYLSTMLINCLILQSYGRSRISYGKWKKYLRICNIQGSSHHKYKLVAYKHLSKCCVELGKLDKSLIYLKKMLKLSWVVDDRNYELLSYDMISVIMYYKIDIVKATFFHDKFVNGDFEEKNSTVRSIGEQNYIYGQELKMHIMDKNSFSEDDFDLDTIIQKSNLEKWAKEQKYREQLKQLKLNENLTFYKKGASFAKHDEVKSKESQLIQKSRILKFKNKQAQQLGPIYRKSDIETTNDTLLVSRNLGQGSHVPVMINHQSPIRQLTQYLFQRDQGIQKVSEDQTEDLNFRPIEQMKVLKKLVSVFQYDLRFYSQHNLLFLHASNL